MATTATKCRPIIFSPQMVRAILGGRKTVTRRVVKPQPKWVEPSEMCKTTDEGWQTLGHSGRWWCNVSTDEERQCPHGVPGDTLWVREAWRIGAWDEDKGTIAIDYRDGPVREWRTIPDDDDGEKFNALWIDCCDELARKGIAPDDGGKYHWEPGESPLRWRPSIHMPRWACRLTLTVETVRVERLQDISEEDARAEGLASRQAFIDIWTTIHARDGFGWAANPWVWVIGFRREEVK